jgi:hypothetical protein
VERRIVGVEEMSWLPLSETTPCRVCGVWRCNQCGWERRPANRLNPDIQHCPRCQTKDGVFVDVRHRDPSIAREHEEDAVRLLGEKP